DTLLTQSLLMELSALCRVEVEEGLALVALIGNNLSKACGVGKATACGKPYSLAYTLICLTRGLKKKNACFVTGMQW
ncbi:hypothetical protein MJL79_30080, partial [Salmonella enterica subsp. enterica serovar Montevideo]|nr:hypothetical protein [Salmonella enterica subsp. enterica serovar Montevideo]